MTIYPVPLRLLTEQHFVDEKNGLTAAGKQEILRDWQQFILNGFKQAYFTPALYEYLCRHCDLPAQFGLRRFWEQQFNNDAGRLKAFINQFGGDRRHIADHNHNWLGGPTADLKLVLCEAMIPLTGPLTQVLSDLEQQHEAMIRVWRDFAQGTVSVEAMPASYRISANTRNLLAYAAHIAQKRPLQALQTMMFAPDLPAMASWAGGQHG